MPDEWQKMRQAAAHQKQQNQESKKQLSKDRLLRIIETKIRTSFIGALSSTEEEFGELWGDGEAPENLNSEELYWFERYQQLRKKILNNGNNQIRAMYNELDQYELQWNRVNTTIQVKEGNEDD
jgi:hypothetical protein